MLWSLSIGFDDWLKWNEAHDNLPTGQEPVMNIHERTSQRQALRVNVYNELVSFPLHTSLLSTII